MKSPHENLLKGRPEKALPAFFHVVLIEPEIPQNTGNIGRTCVGTRSDLHLVGNLGYKITDKNLKRAGLDYWQHLTWTHHADVEEWKKEIKNSDRVFYFSTKATKKYTSVEFKEGDWFVFGKETKGLPKDLLQGSEDRVLQIPILGPVRSLNAATAVAIVLYEAVRQTGV